MAGIDVLSDSTGKRMATALEAINVTLGGTPQKVIYGFHVDGNNSEPGSRVTYVADAVGMEPAKMDYTSGVFDYGSWKNAFFMPKPCMLKYDGTVDYYLDPNDLTKKLDGSASDVANTSYGGNAMMQWGNGSSLIWTKVVPDTDNASGTVYIANYQADDGYHCYNFINSAGDRVDHFYTPIYNGSNIDSKLRSISGQTVCKNQTASGEMTLAKANGTGYNIELNSDMQLIWNLLKLMAKSTDLQTAYGLGNVNNEWNESLLLTTGTMNTKGLFWGESTGVNPYGVKVFGMENLWGNQWRRTAGLINDNGTVKVKVSYDTSDGSTVTDYNTDGSGYVDVGITPGGTSGGYISKVKFTALGAYPAEANGSASTYECDGFWFNNGQNNFALVGGNLPDRLRCGACVSLDSPASGASWGYGAGLSYK